MTYPTLEHVAMDAGWYPDHLLEGCETGLSLFAAGFLGRNDTIHMALAGLTVTCVDNDPDKLAEMRALYPDEWEFVEGDVFEFAATDRQWDVVSVDPWTEGFARCAELVGTWCSLARKAVVLGCGAKTMIEWPPGWKVVDKWWRSDFRGGVYWCGLVPA